MHLSFLRQYILEPFKIFEYEVISVYELNFFLENYSYGDIRNGNIN
jgi:hypothetical protein